MDMILILQDAVLEGGGELVDLELFLVLACALTKSNLNQQRSINIYDVIIIII